MNQLVTIRTFSYAHEAAIVKARLEHYGILCFLKDEHTIQINPLYSNALGGVKLQVVEDDVAEARELLDDIDGFNIPSEKPIVNANGVFCPRCQSDDIVTIADSVVFRILHFWNAIVDKNAKKHNYYCRSCNAQFFNEKP